MYAWLLIDSVTKPQYKRQFVAPIGRLAHLGINTIIRNDNNYNNYCMVESIHSEQSKRTARIITSVASVGRAHVIVLVVVDVERIHSSNNHHTILLSIRLLLLLILRLLVLFVVGSFWQRHSPTPKHRPTRKLYAWIVVA